MRHKFLILSIAVAVVLTSCNRHEAMPTGNYGGRVVAGQVVMASEMAGSTPAGVEVSVVGTGMSATLAADGRFTFIGVPDDAELAFRRADGIDARVRVSSGAPLVVELSGKTATSSGSRRHRVSSKDPGPAQEIEGVVQSVAADSIVVLDSHQQLVTVAIDSSTLIRKGDRVVKAGDLAAGDRVHVKAIQKNSVLTALQVIVQDPDDEENGNDHPNQEVEGVVVAVSADSITVHDSHGADVTMAVTPSTVIRKGNTTLTAGDLKKDDRVHVKATMVDNVLTAVEIIVQQQDDEGEHD